MFTPMNSPNSKNLFWPPFKISISASFKLVLLKFSNDLNMPDNDPPTTLKSIKRQATFKAIGGFLRTFAWVIFGSILSVWLIALFLAFNVGTAGANEGRGYMLFAVLFISGWILVFLFVGWLFWGLIRKFFKAPEKFR